MEEKKIYEGVCSGGPLAGQFMQSRFPEGFLLVDRPNDQCWVYHWNPDLEFFTVKSSDPMPIDRAKRFRTADEPRFDVIAMPLEGGVIQ